MKPFHEWMSEQIEELQDKVGETFNEELTLEEALESINDEVVFEGCITDELYNIPELPEFGWGALPSTPAINFPTEWELKATLAYKLMGTPATLKEVVNFVEVLQLGYSIEHRYVHWASDIVSKNCEEEYRDIGISEQELSQWFTKWITPLIRKDLLGE